MRRFTWVGMAVLGGVSAASAVPTSLISMPIADILKHREVALGYTISGYDRSFQKNYDHLMSGTVGLFDRVEIGGGHDLRGNGNWSAKVLLFENDKGGLSAGWMNIDGGASDPYVVGRLDFGALRVHGGWGRFDKVNTGMVGLDYGFSDRIVFQADHFGGRDGYTWFAASYLLDGGWSLQAAYGKPNNSANPDSHFGFVGYGFRF